MVYTWPRGEGGGGCSRITPIHFSFYGVAVSQSLRIPGLKYFLEICCIWMLLRLMHTKNTQNRTKVCDTSHEDLYVYRRVSEETLGNY